MLADGGGRVLNEGRGVRLKRESRVEKYIYI